MTEKEKLKVALTALESIERNLSAMIIIGRMGRVMSVFQSLKHMHARASEILKSLQE